MSAREAADEGFVSSLTLADVVSSNARSRKEDHIPRYGRSALVVGRAALVVRTYSVASAALSTTKTDPCDRPAVHYVSMVS